MACASLLRSNRFSSSPHPQACVVFPAFCPHLSLPPQLQPHSLSPQASLPSRSPFNPLGTVCPIQYADIMNAETLMALPEGARLAVKIAMSAEMSKVRTLHTGEFRHQTLRKVRMCLTTLPDSHPRAGSLRYYFYLSCRIRECLVKEEKPNDFAVPRLQGEFGMPSSRLTRPEREGQR